MMKKYFLAGFLAGVLCPAALAQSVTVGTSGADYTSLNAAIVAVGANAAEPDVITIQDAGPFLESRVIINIGTSGAADLTIQAVPGVRPVIAINNTGAGANSAVYLRKSGNLIFKDCIIMPTANVTVETSTTSVGQAGIEIDDDNLIPTSVTLQNVLVTSNDGFNQPVASLDGLSSPTFTASTVSFRDEGILALSASTNATRNLYLYDVIVSGVSGDQGSEGIRGFIDGAAGSEWVIGPGCVVSYNNHNDDTVTSASGLGAFQPGGTNGLDVKVLGTQDKPVKFINNNLNGISVTNTTAINDSLSEVRWCIVANNTGVGFRSLDNNTPVEFANVTFANNQDGAFHGPPEADEARYTLSGVIAAGNGGATDPANIIELLADGASPGIFTSSFTATDSAIVLNGPYTLNNVDYGADGIASDSRWVVTTTRVISSDPQFVSLDPTSPGFVTVTNPSYGTAGPGGSALTGGGEIGASSVEDWQLF